MAEAELKMLKHERGQIKSDITRFQSFLRKVDPENIPVQNIQTRCDSIKPLLESFKSIQTKIELSYLDNFPGDYDEADAEQERETFEDRYFDAIGTAQSILLEAAPSARKSDSVLAPDRPDTAIGVTDNSAAVVDEPVAVLPTVTAKLPQLRLPEFTGCYGDWQGFSDAFRALVHDSKTLSNVEKFYYLKGSLKGEPANILASLSVSDSNYNTAWELLIKRYENKKIIVNSHIREIFNLQCSSKESHASLRQFLNAFLKNYRSLESMGENVGEWDTILIFVLTEKLDFNSRKEWEIFSKNITSPKIDNFNEFLLQRCQHLEAVQTKGSLTQSSKKDQTHSNSFVSAQNSEYKKLTCPFCKDSHFIYHCDKFKKLSIDKRIAEVKRMSLCSNCLRFGHKLPDCRSRGCKICQNRHSSLLHITVSHGNERKSENTNQISSAIENTENENSQSPTVLSNYCQNSSSSFILLSTALINALDKNGQPISCRALLDSGSQSNFVTERFLDILQLETTQIDLPVCGINQVKTNISKRTNITISSQNANYKRGLNFLVLPSISSDIPQQTFNVSNFNIPSDIKLADPNFNISSDIDMLIGCEIFFELLCSDQIKLGKGLPILQRTLLGWIVSGNVLTCSKGRKSNAMLSNCFFLHENLDINLEKFWSIEEIASSPQSSMTREELECEKHFTDTFSRDKSGRFIVQLPLKDNFCDLGQSEETALNRLYAIERRLSKSPHLAEYYRSFMKEYQDLGHMSPIPRYLESKYPNYYLPHHSVEKPDSSTTKVRVVFDASCKTSTGLSLNNVLKIGPTIQNDLFSILLRFRQHSYVLIADLAKMYRQILVEPEQRNLQRIVWRNSPEEEVTHFQLNTVTYGTSSASFLSTRCLQQVAYDNLNSYPTESQVILSDFYVDDLLTGTSTPDSLINLRKSICQILSQYGFELRKFQSNNPEVLQDLAKEFHNNDNSHYVISSDTGIKTLGVSWNPSLDIFEYNSENISPNSDIITKRTILSTVAKIFDPLGLLGPLSIRAKIIIQRLWQLNIGWDERLPCDLLHEWLALREEISRVGLIRIPRHALTKNPRNICLHGFADASEKAYACCIYLISMDDNGSVHSHLLCAKSRVAPLKSITLARLELCGCLLLAQLLSKCLKTFSIKIDKIFLWTDSTIVLSWLNGEPRNWKTFVSNRVAEIQRMTNIDDWHHISSGSNPADIISRGARLNELSESDLWWHGPKFLCSPSEQWPKAVDYSKLNLIIPEVKTKSTSLAVTVNPDIDIFSRFSSLNRLIRVFSYCLRFIHNSRQEVNSRQGGNLKVSEIDEATNRLIKLVQLECFKNDIQSLNHNKSVSPKSKLKCLDPFLDTEGITRVGGRLRRSELPFQAKHPILLPGKHAFTKLIVEHEHSRCLHSGIQTTLSLMSVKIIGL